MTKIKPRIKGAFDKADREVSRDHVMRLMRLHRRTGRYIRELRVFRFVNFLEPFAITLDGRAISSNINF